MKQFLFFIVCLVLVFIPYLGKTQAQLAWQALEEQNQKLPASIRLYEYEGKLPTSQRNIRAYYAAIDLKDRQLAIQSIASQGGRGLETTSDLAQQHKALLAINGGYFTFKPDTARGGLSPVSLLVSEGKTIATNQAQVVRKDKGGQATYFPTRSAWGLKGRKTDIAWVYSEGGKTKSYRQPHAITAEGKPQNGKAWKMQEAMGGGPVLVENSQKRITDSEELFTQIAGTHPRTVVGYTANKTLLFLVVDGRQERSEGATFDDLAEIMLGLGAVEAMNLDGGGSSTLWALGKVINSPSDKTGERKVASVIIVKQK